VGRGGFGVVYLAFDTQLKRDVAVKIPRLDVLLNHRLRQRLESEAQAAARLDHPGIVPVYEAGAIGIVSYIATGYCPGPTLAEWIAKCQHPLPCRDAARLVATLSHAVHHAHNRGVLHCDLKPANVLLHHVVEHASNQSRQGEADGSKPRRESSSVGGMSVPRPPVSVSPCLSVSLSHPVPILADFGLARLLTESTAERCIAGTANYMAPEQAEGRTRDIGVATDVYGLGAILHELLTAHRPAARGLSLAASLDTKTLLAHSAVPRDLRAICLKCLQRDPAERYVSAQALADDLERYLRNEPIRARDVGVCERLWKWSRRRPALAALLLLTATSVLAAAGLVAMQQAREVRQREQTRAALRELIFGAEQLLTPEGEMELRPGLPPGPAFEHAERLFAELQSAPELIRDHGLRHELARAARLVAEIHVRLGQPAQARQALERAGSLLESLGDELPKQRLYRLDFARVLCRQAELSESPTGRTAHLTRARQILAELVEEYPDQPAFRRELERVSERLSLVSGKPSTDP
jgi:hypothetical protein